jgi:hypothetical protein
MKEQLIALTISLFLIIVGSVASVIFPQYITIKDSIAIGLFSYIVTLVVFLAARTKLIDSLRQIDSNLAYLSKYVLSREKAKELGADLFSTFWILCLLRAAEGVYRFIDPQTFEISKDQLPQFWLQAAINTDVSWYCTNYVNSPHDWDSGWASWEFQVQSQCMKQVGTSVKRLFIAKDKVGS